MGYNATVVVMLDSLNEISTDPAFGKNLADAINKVACFHGKPVDVSARVGNCTCANAATVIEVHHADQDVYVKVGGNYGEVVPESRILPEEK